MIGRNGYVPLVDLESSKGISGTLTRWRILNGKGIVLQIESQHSREKD